MRKRQNKPSKAEVRQLDVSPWLGTLVLGLWDNTCGPRIDQVWLGRAEASHDDELLSYAVRLTLASEIGAAEQLSSALTQKFHLFAELGTMIVSTSFGVAHAEGAFKYALIVLCDAALLPRYLELADIVQDRMFRLASAIQQLLERRLPAAGHAAHLRRFMGHLDALFACGPSLPPALHPSAGGPPLDAALFALALTAHLQAGCRTVVCSSSPEAAMRLVLALRPFACSRQTALHRLSVAAAYVPDLALQGVLLAMPPMSGLNASFVSDVPSSLTPSRQHSSSPAVAAVSPPIDDARLFQALHPCAVVLLGDSLSSTRVFAAVSAPEYAVLRREHVAGEVARLLAGQHADPPPSFTALRPLRRPAGWAADLAAQLGRLPSSLRPSFAAARFRALELRALTLCRAPSALHLERAVLGTSGTMAGGGGDGKPGEAQVAHSADFVALLGVADALEPSTYVRLAGDPDVLESKFVELFESF